MKEITFSRATSYSDNIIANVFEGISLGFKFSQSQLFAVMQSVLYNLVQPFTRDPELGKMYGARFIQRPLLIIDEIVETLTSNKLH